MSGLMPFEPHDSLPSTDVVRPNALLSEENFLGELYSDHPLNPNKELGRENYSIDLDGVRVSLDSVSHGNVSIEVENNAAPGTEVIMFGPKQLANKDFQGQQVPAGRSLDLAGDDIEDLFSKDQRTQRYVTERFGGAEKKNPSEDELTGFVIIKTPNGEQKAYLVHARLQRVREGTRVGNSIAGNGNNARQILQFSYADFPIEQLTEIMQGLVEEEAVHKNAVIENAQKANYPGAVEQATKFVNHMMDLAYDKGTNPWSAISDRVYINNNRQGIVEKLARIENTNDPGTIELPSIGDDRYLFKKLDAWVLENFQNLPIERASIFGLLEHVKHTGRATRIAYPSHRERENFKWVDAVAKGVARGEYIFHLESPDDNVVGHGRVNTVLIVNPANPSFALSISESANIETSYFIRAHLLPETKLKAAAEAQLQAERTEQELQVITTALPDAFLSKKRLAEEGLDTSSAGLTINTRNAAGELRINGMPHNSENLQQPVAYPVVASFGGSVYVVFNITDNPYCLELNNLKQLIMMGDQNTDLQNNSLLREFGTEFEKVAQLADMAEQLAQTDQNARQLQAQIEDLQTKNKRLERDVENTQQFAQERLDMIAKLTTEINTVTDSNKDLLAKKADYEKVIRRMVQRVRILMSAKISGTFGKYHLPEDIRSEIDAIASELDESLKPKNS